MRGRGVVMRGNSVGRAPPHRPTGRSASALRLISAARRSGYGQPTMPRLRTTRADALSRPRWRSSRSCRCSVAPIAPRAAGGRDRAARHGPDRVPPLPAVRGLAGRHLAAGGWRRTASSWSATSPPSCSSTRSAPTSPTDRKVLASCAFALIAGAIGVTRSAPLVYEYVGSFAIVIGPTLLGVSPATSASRPSACATRRAPERDRSAHIAVAEERARIARELHDVVAHGVSVIAIQADAAEAALERDPALPRRRCTRSAARPGSARRHAAAAGRAARGRGRQRAHAAAGLAQLDALVERARGAGRRGHVDSAGEPRELPASLDLSAFRIVQEALTNARKHADGAPRRSRSSGRGALRAACPRRAVRGANGTARRRPRPGRHARAGEGPRRGAANRPRRGGGFGRPRDPPAAVTRVLIADDQALVRAGLPDDPPARGLEVVGEAGDGAEALELARQWSPTSC